jgi:hypothetical protein
VVSRWLRSLINRSAVPRPSATWAESGQSPEDQNGRMTKEKYGPTLGVSKASGNLSCENHLFPSGSNFFRRNSKSPQIMCDRQRLQTWFIFRVCKLHPFVSWNILSNFGGGVTQLSKPLVKSVVGDVSDCCPYHLRLHTEPRWLMDDQAMMKRKFGERERVRSIDGAGLSSAGFKKRMKVFVRRIWVRDRLHRQRQRSELNPAADWRYILRLGRILRCQWSSARSSAFVYEKACWCAAPGRRRPSICVSARDAAS